MGAAEKASLKLQFDPKVRLEFHGATITSDAGLLACRELDDALGLTDSADEYLHEGRTGRNIRHQLSLTWNASAPGTAPIGGFILWSD